MAVSASCVPSGTLIVNDDYAVACAQDPDPVVGPAITTTVLYEAPQATFSLTPSEVNLGESVVFTNTSRYATAYLWDFDGITSTSAVNPFGGGLAADYGGGAAATFGRLRAERLLHL